MTGHLELWLLAAVAGLVMLSNRLGVPYPVFLVRRVERDLDLEEARLEI